MHSQDIMVSAANV